MNKNQIIRLGALILLGIFIFLIRNVLFPIVIAILLYYILNPVVNWLSKKRPSGVGLNRTLAILISFIIFFIVLVVAAFFIIPTLIEEFNIFVANVPQYLAQLQVLLDSLDHWQATANLPQNFDNMFMNILQNLFSLVAIFGQNTVNLMIGILSRFIYIIIIPLVTFFLLHDDVYLARGFINYLPPEHRQVTARTLKEIDNILKNYVVGQAILCFIVGVVTSGVLYLWGIKFALILGLVAAVAQLIPNIGPFIGAAPTLIIAAVISPVLALEALAFFMALNILLVAVLAPKILGDKLNLHPLTIVLSVLILGELAGMWGLFLAAPITAILKVLYLELRQS